MDKAEARKYVRSFKGPLGGSEEVWRQLETVSGFIDSDTVLLYSSIDGEVDTKAFVDSWYGRKRIVLPRVVGDVLELREYSPDRVRAGYRGILEPDDLSPLVDPDEIGLAVVPGLAFDREGHRLGRGKGYYDRLLPSLSCCRIGVAFEHQLLDHVPCEDHDVKMDMVITPNNSYICADKTEKR